ncbi:hypothetical protein HDU87_006918 [Geranomyces variabilis]|uniref:Uncharacterized protein n=1 Tax=Geranomyces variabilis TaxID=109894 RepID=A0AAD5TEV2_9FUNG|nr:hypothetical protein HDU87_006918 [Geranomyces variabilis]
MHLPAPAVRCIRLARRPWPRLLPPSHIRGHERPSSSSSARIDFHDVFPWPTKGSPPRRSIPPPAGKFVLTKLLDNIKSTIGETVAEGMVHRAYGERYIENEFIAGASYAFTNLLEVISDKSTAGAKESDDDTLASLLGPLLRVRYQTALAELAAQKSRISLKVVKLHDAAIVSYGVTFGPQLSDAGAAKMHISRIDPDGRVVLRTGMHGEFVGALRPGIPLMLLAREAEAMERIARGESSGYREGVHAFENGGMIVSLRVTFEGTFRYTVTTNGVTVFDETERRDIDVVFDGLPLTSDQAYNGAGMLAKPPPLSSLSKLSSAGRRGHWRIADIDDVVAEQLWDAYVRKRKRASGGKARAPQ